jgi:hypothetical protein
MKSILIVPPILALVSIIGWTGSERHSLAMLEKESDALQARLTSHSSTSMQISVDKLTQKNQPTHFKKLAAMMTEALRSGSKLAMMHLEQQCKGMMKEELISALDEIDGMKTDEEWRDQLKSILFKQLCKKDLNSALTRFGDPSRSDRAEMCETLATAMKDWSKKDLMMTETWLDEQIAAGKFDSATWDGKNEVTDYLKASLLGAWLTIEPITATARLNALPKDQRLFALRCYSSGSIEEKDQLTFANHVRTLLPEGDRAATLARFACRLGPEASWRRLLGKHESEDWYSLPSDYSPVSKFFDRIGATATERENCVERTVLAKFGVMPGPHFASEKIAALRAWATEQAPSKADNLTSKLLWYNTNTGSTFSQVAEQAVRYSDASGNDGLLFEFLSQKVPKTNKDEARLLAEKITDPARRQIVLDGLK